MDFHSKDRSSSYKKCLKLIEEMGILDASLGPVSLISIQILKDFLR